MARNIVVCCDGTSNQYAWDKTNVLKLYSSLIHDPQQQLTYYHPGVGTMGPPGALTAFDSLWTRVAGLAFGRGLEDDIRDAYTFLAQNFEEGDQREPPRWCLRFAVDHDHGIRDGLIVVMRKTARPRTDADRLSPR